MSWSVSATGKAPVVAGAIERQFSGYAWAVRQQARATIAAALSAQSPAVAVKVTAFGSQSTLGHFGGPDIVTNNLSIVIEPIHGFLE